MKAILVAAGLALSAMPAQAQDLVAKLSPHDVVTTMDRLESAVEEAGAKVFARVDHAAGAESVDMELRPTQLLIFGNPKLGTPAMQDSQTVGLDLPMRVLIYADGEGAVHVAYAAPENLAATHGLPEEAEYIEKMTKALDNLTAKAIGDE